MHWTQKHEKDMLNHYIALAKTPGWLDYAKHQIKLMQRDSEKTGFHKNIKDQFIAAMTEKS